MRTKAYKIMANEKPADVVANNDIKLGGGYTLDEAWKWSLIHQRTGQFIAVWIEEEPKPKTPRVVRSAETTEKGIKLNVVRCDGWVI